MRQDGAALLSIGSAELMLANLTQLRCATAPRQDRQDTELSAAAVLGFNALCSEGVARLSN